MAKQEENLIPKVNRSKKKCIADRKDGQGVVEFNAKQITALGLDVNKNTTNELRKLELDMSLDILSCLTSL